MSGFEYLSMHVPASIYECEESAAVIIFENVHMWENVCTYSYDMYNRGCMYMCSMCFCVFVSICTCVYVCD